MVLEDVIWTTIPHQQDDESRLRITVHLGPRLTNDDGSSTRGTLRDARMFLDWPRSLARMKFRVEFDNGTVCAGIAMREADSALWSHLFPRETPLVPFVFQDHSQRDLHSFPVRGVHQFLQKAYGAVAAGGSEVPSIDDVFGPLAHFAPLEPILRNTREQQSFWQEMYRARGGVKGPGRVVRDSAFSGALSASDQAVQSTFLEASRFYRRPGSQNPDLPPDYIEPSPKPPEFDFHQRVSLYADHPRILRMLGLVVDLTVDLRDPLQILPATGNVRVIPEGETGTLTSKSPWTAYELDREMVRRPTAE